MKFISDHKLSVFVICLLLAFAIAGTLSPGPLESAGPDPPKKKDALRVGMIIAWAGDPESVPTGWRVCDGRSLSKQQYPELFKAIGTSWGGKGEPDFNLPDLRGRFLRGVDAGAGRDPDADKREASRPGGNTKGVGSVQEDSFQNHTHVDSGHVHTIHSHGGSAAIFPDGSGYVFAYNPGSDTENTRTSRADLKGAVKFGTKKNVRKGEETRPVNASVYWIIKVK